MTDDKSPGDRLLELVVFGPTGLAVTLVEEFPKLVEKGRHRVEGQVHTARLVGPVRRPDGPSPDRADRSATSRAGPTADAHDGAAGAAAHADVRDRCRRRTESTAVADVARDAEAVRTPRRRRRRRLRRRSAGRVVAPHRGRARVPRRGGRRCGWGAGAQREPTSPSSLAIPGYDSLSASQVVQRLEGLSPPELEEVRAHEAAHRQRRTILHRVEQLLAGGDGARALADHGAGPGRSRGGHPPGHDARTPSGAASCAVRRSRSCQRARGGALFVRRETGLIAKALLRPGGLDRLLADPRRRVARSERVDDAVVGMAIGRLDEVGETRSASSTPVTSSPRPGAWGWAGHCSTALVAWFTTSGCRGVDISALPGDRRHEEPPRGVGVQGAPHHHAPHPGVTAARPRPAPAPAGGGGGWRGRA